VRKNLLFTTFGLIALLLTAWPATAEAQRRDFGHGPGLRVGVVFGGGSLYDPWFQGRYPYPYPYPPYGYGYEYDGLTSALRLQVTPKQAEVYVDGYRAGIVDDFDGVFQRLHVPPGNHELVLYLDGYVTVRQRVHLNPDKTEKIVYTMERLRPGESSGPRPEPSHVEQPAPAGPPMGRRGGRAPVAPAPPARPMPPMPAMPPGPPGDVQADPSRIGSIAIRVQPANADVIIDGEHWSGPAGQDRLVVQLPAGKHRLEVQKDGYEKFSADVQIRAGETTTVNVSLLRSVLLQFAVGK
jgi:hypothetical protein